MPLLSDAAAPASRPALAAEESPIPGPVPRQRRKRKGLAARLKAILDVRREKRIRIGTQLLIYGLALTIFLVILYGITQGRLPGF